MNTGRSKHQYSGTVRAAFIGFGIILLLFGILVTLGASVNAVRHTAKHSSLATDLLAVILFGLIPVAAGIWLGIKGFRGGRVPEPTMSDRVAAVQAGPAAPATPAPSAATAPVSPDRQAAAGLQETAPAQPLLPGRPAGPRVAAAVCGILLVLGGLFMLLGALIVVSDSKNDDSQIFYLVLQETVLTPLLLGSYLCANGFRAGSSPGVSVVERLLAGATALMLLLAGGQNLYFTARNLRDGRMVSVDFIVVLLSLAAIGGAVMLARISLRRDDIKETPYQIASS